MLIALDCDGCMCSFTGGILEFVNTTLRPDAGMTDEDITQWNVSTALGLTKDEDALLVEHIKTEGFCAGLDVVPGTVSVLAALRTFADVICVTSPYDSKYWEWERRQWLYSKLGFDRKTVVFADNKNLVKADILLDDKAETVRSYPYGVPVLFARPWNDKEEWHGQSIYDWKQFFGLCYDLRRLASDERKI